MTTSLRTHGLVLSGTALAWAAGTAVYGVDPSTTDPVASTVHYVTAGLFQVGLLALLQVLWRTGAVGRGRVARTALTVEGVLVAVATLTSLARLVGAFDGAAWAALDAAWPLSMLGMLALAVRVAVARRLPGAVRVVAPLAMTWGVVMLVAFGAGGEAVATVVSVAHLCLGYVVLGQLLVRRSAQAISA